MIWTVLLGLSLATVFFFFSQRLSMNALVQRDTIRIQNANALLESYAGYLEGLDTATLESLRDSGIDYAGITGTVTNVKDEIMGTLDAGESKSYSVSDADAGIDFILCPDELGRPFEVDGTPTPSGGTCVTPYDGITAGSGTFSISAPSAPVSYKIKPQAGGTLYDNEWQADLQVTITSRKTITISRTFVPGS